jgi:hypothetical protein
MTKLFSPRFEAPSHDGEPGARINTPPPPPGTGWLVFPTAREATVEIFEPYCRRTTLLVTRPGRSDETVASKINLINQSTNKAKQINILEKHCVIFLIPFYLQAVHVHSANGVNVMAAKVVTTGNK